MSLAGKRIKHSNKTFNRKIYFTTAYGVPQHDSATPGHKTVFMQQKRLLTLRGKVNPKPRTKIFHDRSQQVQEWRADDADVILCMDANADITDKELQKLMSETGLVDAMAHELGAHLPETYIRGRKTIDHILVSPGLINTIRGAGHLAYSYKDGIVADHRGMFLDFERKSLLGARHELAERPARLLTTKDPKGAAKYQSEASGKIRSNPIYHRLVEIERYAQDEFTPSLKQAFEQVDNELHTILIDAENVIDKQNHLPWSPPLHSAYQIWLYWKI
jgi:hypothetical protein